MNAIRKAGSEPASATDVRAALRTRSGRSVNSRQNYVALGMNPGMPVFTTGLSLTRVVIP